MATKKTNEKQTLELYDRMADALETIAGGGGGGGGGGGSGLPAVTAEDNGDVLTVVEGAWAKAAPKYLAVQVTATYDENDALLTCECNKTFEDIINADIISFYYADDSSLNFNKSSIIQWSITEEDNTYYLDISFGDYAPTLEGTITDYPNFTANPPSPGT